jgi:4-hydroxyphenylpyruvate dioxygenase
VSAVGLLVPDQGATSARAAALMAPALYRRTYASEQPLGSAAAPDGTEFFWVSEPVGGAAPAWVGEFSGGAHGDAATTVRRVDHVNLSQPWQSAHDEVLFLASVFGLAADDPTEVPGPSGLVRSQVLRTADGAVRIPLNVAPHVLDGAGLPQHVAFECSDVRALAAESRARGARLLRVPDNYYDYLAGRFGLAAALVAELADLGVLYDRDEHGEFLHFYTRTVGSVFFEFTERRGGYDGYGAANAPVRLAAQRVGTVQR